MLFINLVYILCWLKNKLGILQWSNNNIRLFYYTDDQNNCVFFVLYNDNNTTFTDYKI